MRWLVWCVVVAGVDLLLRFGVSLSFSRVLAAEGVLFVAAGGILAWMVERWTRAGSRGRGWGRGVAAAMGVGGVRSLAWGLGAPVFWANLAALASGLLLVWGMWGRWRR